MEDSFKGLLVVVVDVVVGLKGLVVVAHFVCGPMKLLLGPGELDHAPFGVFCCLMHMKLEMLTRALCVVSAKKNDFG